MVLSNEQPVNVVDLSCIDTSLHTLYRLPARTAHITEANKCQKYVRSIIINDFILSCTCTNILCTYINEAGIDPEILIQGSCEEGRE